MSLRSRIFLATMFCLLVPFLFVAYAIRSGMKGRLSDLYVERVEASTRLIDEDLDERGRDLASRLGGLKEEILDDNRFRRSLVRDDADLGRYRIDYAGRLVRLSGLSMLRILDAEGRIVSSGRFRNSYGQLERSLASMPLRAAGKLTLVHSRTPEGDLLTLGQRVPFRMGEKEYSLVGGVEIPGALMRGVLAGSEMTIRLIYPHPVRSTDPWIQDHLIAPPDPESGKPVLDPDEYFLHDLELFYVAPDAVQPNRGRAVLTVGHSRIPLRSLLRNLDLWLGLYLLVILVGTVLLARWISERISRPIRELADEVTAVDVDRLNVEFASDRADEVGELSRFLTSMTERLRASLVTLREVERRAAFGDLARQVNHDIRNGLAPIRNAVRHLAQVAKENPADLGSVFAERREHIESGIDYLEQLSANYARLTPRSKRQPVDLNAVVRQLCEDLCLGEQRAVRLQLASDLPLIHADPVGVRRIVENLVRNAAEALEGAEGEISVTTALIVEGNAETVALTVADTGKGIAREEIDRVFENFHTTKEGGTGLGLSIVRRLVNDFGGRIGLESEVGVGTKFTVRLPPMEGEETETPRKKR